MSAWLLVITVHHRNCMAGIVGQPFLVYARYMKQAFIRLGLGLCALALPTLVLAAVYKHVGPDGQIVYSDQPQPGAEEIKIDVVPTPPAPSAAQTAADPDPDIDSQTDFAGYTRLTVTRPENDATVRENSGIVAVEIALEPALQVEAGHKIAVSLDGTTLPDISSTSTFQVSNVDRGTHSLLVSVLDANGAALISSASVTFHMKRESSGLNDPTTPGATLPAPVDPDAPPPDPDDAPTRNPLLAPKGQQAPQLPSPFPLPAANAPAPPPPPAP